MCNLRSEHNGNQTWNNVPESSACTGPVLRHRPRPAASWYAISECTRQYTACCCHRYSAVRCLRSRRTPMRTKTKKQWRSSNSQGPPAPVLQVEDKASVLTSPRKLRREPSVAVRKSETVAIRYPVMPIVDGIGLGFLVDGSQFGQRCQSNRRPSTMA